MASEPCEWLLEFLGKTLILELMDTLIKRVVRLMTPTRGRLGHALIPRQLLEKAVARAGSDPRQAAELRGAALAYLSVVR
jgi:hypothetical protein